MSTILKTQEVYEYDNESLIGYLGINLKTGEVSVYRYSNNDNEELVYKVDPEDKNFYKNIFYNGEYKRLTLEGLSTKGQILVNSAIKKQLQYSKKLSLSINEIEKVLKELEFGLNYKTEQPHLRYNVLSNSILISNIQALLTDNVNKDEEKLCVDSILFGLGELKVSSIIYDKENNWIKIKTGFYEDIIDVEEIKRFENGDEFIIASTSSLRKNKKGQVLDLIFNDLECREMDKTYESCISQTYGPLLDFITEGKLRSARYNGGLSMFHEIMNQIIPDTNISEELLDLIENGNLDDEVYKVLSIYADKVVENKCLEGTEKIHFIKKCESLGAIFNNQESLEMINKLTRKKE